jgi:hypothetical protein
MAMETLVERFVNAFLANPAAEPDVLVNLLRREGISAEEAECLLAFVPMAFAHVLLGPMGVRLPSRFQAWDPDTNEKQSGVLKDEPIFAAAVSVATKGAADARVRAVANSSAEWDVVRKLTSDGSSAEGCVLTEPLLSRVPLAYFRRARKPRSRWAWLTGR